MTLGHCFYCAQPMWAKNGENRCFKKLAKRFGVSIEGRKWKRLIRWRQRTKEHLIRRCEGGTRKNKNIVFACSYCNSHRGDESPEIHKRAMEYLVMQGQHPCQRG